MMCRSNGHWLKGPLSRPAMSCSVAAHSSRSQCYRRPVGQAGRPGGGAWEGRKATLLQVRRAFRRAFSPAGGLRVVFRGCGAAVGMLLGRAGPRGAVEADNGRGGRPSLPASPYVLWLQLQRSLYTALYAAVWPLPWVAGIFPWAWSAGDYLPGASWVPMGGARFSTDFDVAGKPAQARGRGKGGRGGTGQGVRVHSLPSPPSPQLAIAAAYGGVPEPQPPASARWSTAAAAAGRAAMDAPPAPLALYSDGSLSPGWVDWSFSANVTLRDPTQPFPGHTASLGASVAPEGAVALHTAAGVPVATAGFTALSFDVILAAPAALSSALSAWLCFCDGCNDSAGCQGPSVPVVTYTAGGGSCVLAGAWGQAAAHASVPLAALLPAGPQADWPAVRRVQLGYAYDAGNAALVMTLDNVQFE